ncbi:MAG: hypothetical protein RML72_00740 [Bacteroidia bacterium]|nr:hypothetical protein [Bacteroidia bacterium]MDW8157392.1 hypothetical protein [Bacteroidia bacterium]
MEKKQNFDIGNCITSNKPFAVPSYWPVAPGEEVQFEDYTTLLEWLSSKIFYLLQHDFPALLQLLYYIDIPEALSNSIFQQKDLEWMARQIAELMIRRELKKKETRQKYRTGEY